MRLNGPIQGAPRFERDPGAQSTRDVATTRKVAGPVDTFDSNNRSVVSDAPASESKGFFSKIFSAVGRFFSSIWSFLTGKGWPAQSDASPATDNARASSDTQRPNIQVTSPEQTLRRAATSATAPGARVGSEARVRSADEVRGTARVASGATFAGVPIREVGQWYTGAVGTAFGGELDPDDNGISAFGYRTGPGGREGVAIPQRIMAELTGTNDKSVHQQYEVEVTNRATGKTAVFDIVDRGPSEDVWRREGKAVVDLTEGAVAELGGSVLKNRRGEMISTTGLDNVSFRVIRR